MSSKVSISELYQARLEELKELAISKDIAKGGNVEMLRARLIAALHLTEYDLSSDGLQDIQNSQLGEILHAFGIKKSGSMKHRRQRIWLHLNHDPKKLTPETLDDMTREELHELCSKLKLKRSGSKSALLARVAGVLASQEGAWGKVKKSLRRPRKAVQQAVIEQPQEDEHSWRWSENVAAEVMDDHGLDDLEELIEEAKSHDEINETWPEGNRYLKREELEAAAEVLASEDDFEQESSALMEFNARRAEFEAAIRDFLVIGNPDDSEDVEAFIDSLSMVGLATDVAKVRNAIAEMIADLSARSLIERQAVDMRPDSWRSREEIRKFENMRERLRKALSETIGQAEGDMVAARMAFEEVARSSGLDLRIPAISGRVHALFDLQVSLMEAEALQDPGIARRERVIAIMQQGAVHLSHDSQRTVNRLEKSIKGFEQLIDAILERSEGVFGPAEQAMLIRFLESRGHQVNTTELRSRILACAGIMGVELGHLQHSDVPRLPEGMQYTQTEVDAVVADLRRLVVQFKDEPEPQTDDEELNLGEAVSDASDRVSRVRKELDDVDALLNRLRLD